MAMSIKSEPDFYVNVVIVGDERIGKTSLLTTYATGSFPRQYVPTIFDQKSRVIKHAAGTVCLELHDTAGQEEFDRLRLLSYPLADVFLVAFDISNPSSFQNIEPKWFPELKYHRPECPIVLVGTKVDLKDKQETVQKLRNKGQVMTSQEEINGLMERMEAKAFAEVSSKEEIALNELFDLATDVVLKNQQKAACCTIL